MPLFPFALRDNMRFLWVQRPLCGLWEAVCRFPFGGCAAQSGNSLEKALINEAAQAVTQAAEDTKADAET